MPSTRHELPLVVAAPAWWLYLVRTRTGTLYTGIALDVPARLAAHAAGAGAKALRGRGPLQLVLTARVGGHGAALRLEARVKRLPKAAKELLATAGLPAGWLRAARAGAARRGRSAAARGRTAPRGNRAAAHSFLRQTGGKR